MTTTTHFHSFHPAATTLPGRGAQALRRPTAPATLWQQSVRINDGRSVIERLVCLFLVLLAAAAILYGASVTFRTFQDDHFQQAVAKIANHDAR